MKIKDTLQKAYKMRLNVAGRKSIIVAMPYEVIEREARKVGLEVDEFIKRYQAIAQYDSFDGVHYIFKEGRK